MLESDSVAPFSLGSEPIDATTKANLTHLKTVQTHLDPRYLSTAQVSKEAQHVIEVPSPEDSEHSQ